MYWRRRTSVRAPGRASRLDKWHWLVEPLLTRLAAGLSTLVFARFVGDSAQLVKDTALFDHPSAVHLSHGGPQFTFAIPNDGLQPGFWAYAPFPEAVKQALSVGSGFPLGDFPIEHFAPAAAISPQSQGQKPHHALPLVLLRRRPRRSVFRVPVGTWSRSQMPTGTCIMRRYERMQPNTTAHRLTPALA